MKPLQKKRHSNSSCKSRTLKKCHRAVHEHRELGMTTGVRGVAVYETSITPTNSSQVSFYQEQPRYVLMHISARYTARMSRLLAKILAKNWYVLGQLVNLTNHRLRQNFNVKKLMLTTVNLARTTVHYKQQAMHTCTGH